MLNGADTTDKEARDRWGDGAVKAMRAHPTVANSAVGYQVYPNEFNAWRKQLAGQVEKVFESGGV